MWGMCGHLNLAHLHAPHLLHLPLPSSPRHGAVALIVNSGEVVGVGVAALLRYLFAHLQLVVDLGLVLV